MQGSCCQRAIQKLAATAVGRTKQKNISRDQKVALALVDQNNQYDMVTARGKVVEQIKGKEAEDHADKLAKKYLGIDKYPRRVLMKFESCLKLNLRKYSKCINLATYLHSSNQFREILHR